MQYSTKDIVAEIAEERIVTDEEIMRQARDEWVGVLASMWDAIGKPLDNKRLFLYCSEMSILPLGLLEQTVKRAIRANTYNNIPTIGALWEAARIELNMKDYPTQTIEQVIELWEENSFERCLYRFGSTE